MTLAAMVLLIFVQEDEVKKLKEENRVLSRQLEVQMTQILELQNEIRKLKVATRKPLEGKVTAVSNDIGLIVINLGKDQGITLGDEFTVTRNGAFIAKVAVDRVDEKWSSARVSLKKEDPRVADDVSTAIFLVTPTRPLDKGKAEDLREIRKELDEVRRQIRELSDQLLPSWGAQGFAADDLTDEWRGHYGVTSGLLIRRVREGSAAEKAGLRRFDVVRDLDEAGLIKAVREGSKIRVIRAGQEQVLGK